jgi:hypothetical protein
MSEKLNWIDGQALPEWGEGPDKRLTRIAADERLPALYSEWLADACNHPSKVIIETTDSLGRTLYFEHCEHCGLRTSSAISHAKANNASRNTPANTWMRGTKAIPRSARNGLTPWSGRLRRRPRHQSRSYDDYLRSERGNAALPRS